MKFHITAGWNGQSLANALKLLVKAITLKHCNKLGITLFLIILLTQLIHAINDILFKEISSLLRTSG